MLPLSSQAKLVRQYNRVRTIASAELGKDVVEKWCLHADW
jgi:hypothetical protein